MVAELFGIIYLFTEGIIFKALKKKKNKVRSIKFLVCGLHNILLLPKVCLSVRKWLGYNQCRDYERLKRQFESGWMKYMSWRNNRKIPKSGEQKAQGRMENNQDVKRSWHWGKWGSATLEKVKHISVKKLTWHCTWAFGSRSV